MAPPAKKRKLLQTTAVEEVTFDYDARQEYLTGFHKRKLQRAKHAQEIAAKRAREDKIEDRRKLREERKADLERHVQEVNALLQPAIGPEGSDDGEEDDLSGGEWNGVEDVAPPPIDHEAEYIDEEMYTTVTVEAIDVSRDGLHKAKEADGNTEDLLQSQEEKIEPETKVKTGKVILGTRKLGKREWTKEKPKDRPDKPEIKRKKFRYEGKAERKFTRMKEKSKNSKEAKARREREQ